VSATQTIKAIRREGYPPVPWGTASYTIGSSTTPAVNYPRGFTASGLSFMASHRSGGALVVTMRGFEGRPAWNSTPDVRSSRPTSHSM